MRRALSLSFIPLLLGVLIGCGPQEAPAKLKQRQRTYTRIVSLSPGTTEILAASLSVSNLVGRTAACNYPTYITEKTPVVGSVKPDWEKLREARPDFIVYDAALYTPQDVAKMKETGATLFGLTAKNIDEFQLQLFELANFVAPASRASEYVDKIHQERQNATGNAAENRPKVSVILPGVNGQHMILGTESFLADEVRAAGGEPVGPKTDKFVPLSPESLLTFNPDAIVVPARDPKDSAGALAVANDPRFKGVTAVKDRRIGAVLGDVLLRTGSRVDTCIKGIYRIITSK